MLMNAAAAAAAEAAAEAAAVQAAADLAELQALLDEALANAGGGSCDPIYIDILEGWNIVGYTLPFGQDVAATVADIVDILKLLRTILRSILARVWI